MFKNGSTPMTSQPLRIRLADHSQNRPVTFALRPDAAQLRAIAADLGLLGLRKLAFSGQLVPLNRRDWQLEAQLGATVVQACVVSLDPVTTRIDDAVRRQYLAEMPETPETEEVEMPEDDTIDPLPETVDLEQVMIEALALALPLYPRAEGVAPVAISVTEPGKAPLTDAAARPFSALAALRDKLAEDDTQPPPLPLDDKA